MTLAPQRYIELIRSDGELLLHTAAQGLRQQVPPCPGWDVREVVRHTGSVYQHKLACIRLGRRPEEGEWQHDAPQGEDLLLWFRAAHAALVDELVAHSPDTPAYTWWPPDQTVGFWYRRMALETVVHRVDVESAFGNVTAVAADLAEDGAAEILEIMLSDEDANSTGDGASGGVAVHCGESSWTVRLSAGATGVVQGESMDAATTVSGDPSALFLYLWGRAPLDAVQVEGDRALVAALRGRLAAATQ